MDNKQEDGHQTTAKTNKEIKKEMIPQVSTSIHIVKESPTLYGRLIADSHPGTA